MKLHVYLATNRMSLRKFCEKIECSSSYLSRVNNGHVKPSKRLAKDIEKETNGQVTAAEVLDFHSKVDSP